jgi:hypothetical protein
MTRRQKLKAALAAIVDAMVPEETLPPPPAAPSPPGPGHQAHLVPAVGGFTMCCPAHEAQYEASCRRGPPRLTVIPFERWLAGRR